MKNLLTILNLTCLIIFVGSCGEPDYPEPVPSVNAQSSKLLVVHTFAGAPKYTIKVDNKISEKDTVRYEKSADGNSYSNITLAIPAGPNRLVTVSDQSDKNLVTDRYIAAASMNNTSFISSSIVNDVAVPVIVRVSDDLASPDPGFAKVRFFNLSPDAGELIVTSEGGASTIFTARKFKEISRKTGSTTVEFNRFSNIAIAGYPASTSTTVNYEVRSTSNDLLLSMPAIKLESKSIYTIYLKGLTGGSGDTALSYAIIKH